MTILVKGNCMKGTDITLVYDDAEKRKMFGHLEVQDCVDVGVYKNTVDIYVTQGNSTGENETAGLSVDKALARAFFAKIIETIDASVEAI